MAHTNIPVLLIRTGHLLMALVALTVLVACSCSSTTALENTAWELESLNGNDVLPGTTITIEFSGDQISGSAGCNHYGGSYQARESRLNVSDLFWTEMGCLEPEGILEQEQAYLDALSAAARYQIDGEGLEIFDNAGTRILVFVTSNSAAAMATPATEQSTPAPPTLTADISALETSATVKATPALATRPRVGFQQYRDSVTDVSVYITESWMVTGVVPSQSAIL